jgi:DNA repair exonuclease SbcCD nuclease subunit
LISASFDAFRNLVDLAHEADMLLMAGDVLEVDVPHLRARLELIRSLESLSRKGVKVFLVAGNHDPYPMWKAFPLPDNVHLFSPQGEEKRFLCGNYAVSVCGISHGGRDVKENLVLRLPQGEGDLRIALVHAFLEGQTGHDSYAPCSLRDLMSRDFHYWALGHIHQRREVARDDSWVIYPGNIQGRHPGETGEKGCYKVCWSNGEGQIEFCQLSPVVWMTESLALSDIRTSEKLVGYLDFLKEEKRWKGGTILRVILEGPSDLYGLMEDDWQQVLDMINESEDREDFVWTVLERRLTPPLDLKVLSRGEGFIAHLIREAGTLEKDMGNLSLDRELGLLWHHKEVSRLLGGLTQEKKVCALREALRSALASLIQREAQTEA